MKTKLSALDKLKAERLQLQAECSMLESRIGHNIYYVRHNFGSLLASGIFGNIKNTLGSLFGGGGSSLLSNPDSSLSRSALFSVWNIARPFAVGWVTKKIASRLFK